MNPEDLKYTKEHEWLRIEDTVATVGITEHAQDELGDVVYVELPTVGSQVTQGLAFGTVESVKAVSELFSPVTGEIIDVNAQLEASPELLNTDPYGKGWLISVRVASEPDAATLLDRTAYEAFISGGQG
jgi:glycine cleavage system H protein